MFSFVLNKYFMWKQFFIIIAIFAYIGSLEGTDYATLYFVFTLIMCLYAIFIQRKYIKYDTPKNLLFKGDVQGAL
jgi:hypothetical protein